MVPVSAFAAVAAMAGPQRVAAEASMQEAAGDLATFAAVWRDGYEISDDEVAAFPPDCEDAGLDPDLQGALDAQNDVIADLDEDNPLRIDEELRLAELEAEIDSWTGACAALSESVLEDLGRLGVASYDLSGTYSANYWDADRDDPVRGDLDYQALGLELPCKASLQFVVGNSVHVAIVADWTDAGWAAAQVWPSGQRLGAESLGHLTVWDPDSSLEFCDYEQFELTEASGTSVWTGNDPDASPRQVVQTLRRVPFGG